MLPDKVVPSSFDRGWQNEQRAEGASPFNGSQERESSAGRLRRDGGRPLRRGGRSHCVGQSPEKRSWECDFHWATTLDCVLKVVPSSIDRRWQNEKRAEGASPFDGRGAQSHISPSIHYHANMKVCQLFEVVPSAFDRGWQNEQRPESTSPIDGCQEG